MKTYFATSERIPKDEAYEHYNKLLENKSIINIIEAFPETVIILNKFRQIVFANKIFLKLINKKDIKDVIGLRPGEAVGCIYSDSNEGGCGTSTFCKFCGAVKAILTTIEGKEATEECKILTKNNQCLLLKVKTVPVEIDGIIYTLFTISDIRDTKALKEYQKLLFIDINEIISEIVVALEVLKNEYKGDVFIENLYNVAQQGIELIENQKLLISAENNELKLFPVSIDAKDFLFEVKNLFKSEKIIINENCENVEFTTDVKLLTIVFKNIIVSVFNLNENNVILSCFEKDGYVEFVIKSSKILTPEIQYDLFKKDLLTKPSSEGIATYLAKIIIEWYLKGKIYYNVDYKKGTEFHIKLEKDFIV